MMIQAAAADITKAVLDSLQKFIHKQAFSVATTVEKYEPTVELWSSEIAACMEKDSWLSRTQALAKVWKRTNEKSYKEAKERWLARGRKPLHFTSKDVMAESILPRSKDVKNSKIAVDPYVFVQTMDDVKNFKKEHSAKEVMKMYRSKGKILEEETSDIFAATIHQSISYRNAAAYWSPLEHKGSFREMSVIRPLGPIINPGPYVIVGELDGCLAHAPFENVPVEFKLRMTGLPESIPFRDIAQIQSYMAMTGSKKAFHVQRIFGSDEVLTTTIEWDETLWSTQIQPALETFVCDIRKLLRGSLADEELRHIVLQTSEGTTNLPVIIKTEERKKKQKRQDEPCTYNLRSRKKAM